MLHRSRLYDIPLEEYNKEKIPISDISYQNGLYIPVGCIVRGVFQITKPRFFNGICFNSAWRELQKHPVEWLEVIVGRWPEQYLIMEISMDDAKSYGRRGNTSIGEYFAIPEFAWKDFRLDES